MLLLIWEVNRRSRLAGYPCDDRNPNCPEPRNRSFHGCDPIVSDWLSERRCRRCDDALDAEIDMSLKRRHQVRDPGS
jgi:hypothetical protein